MRCYNQSSSNYADSPAGSDVRSDNTFSVHRGGDACLNNKFIRQWFKYLFSKCLGRLFNLITKYTVN